MATFRYSALTKSDTIVRGSVEAKTAKAAVRVIEAEGMLMVNMQRMSNKVLERISDFFTQRIFHTVSHQDRIALTRNLQVMLNAGISIDKAIATTAEQTSNKQFRTMLVDIERSVQRGTALNVALKRHERSFSPFFINFIKIGETSGKLDTVLTYLLEQQEKDDDLRRNARGAMLYPAVIIVALFIMVTLMMIIVIPRVTGILNEYNVALPLTTRILVAVSGFLVSWGFVFFPVLAVLIYLFHRWTTSERGKPRWDGFLLRLPYVSRIIKEFNVARFSLAITSLLESGITLDQALSYAANVPNHTAYRVAARDSIRYVRRGVNLTEVLKRYPHLYPPLLRRMVELGEESGKLNSMVKRAAQFYERSVDRTMRNISTVIEPVLLITVGLVVGFVAVSILTPIWSFSATV